VQHLLHLQRDFGVIHRAVSSFVSPPPPSPVLVVDRSSCVVDCTAPPVVQ
jgi:hypothetical protein